MEEGILACNSIRNPLLSNSKKIPLFKRKAGREKKVASKEMPELESEEEIDIEKLQQKLLNDAFCGITDRGKLEFIFILISYRD
jgi:hypothetical protein